MDVCMLCMYVRTQEENERLSSKLNESETACIRLEEEVIKYRAELHDARRMEVRLKERLKAALGGGGGEGKNDDDGQALSRVEELEKR